MCGTVDTGYTLQNMYRKHHTASTTEPTYTSVADHVVSNVWFHHICCPHWYSGPKPVEFLSVSPALLSLLPFAWHKVLYYFYWCLLYDICRYGCGTYIVHFRWFSQQDNASCILRPSPKACQTTWISWMRDAGAEVGVAFFFCLFVLKSSIFHRGSKRSNGNLFIFVLIYTYRLSSVKRFPCLSSFCRQPERNKGTHLAYELDGPGCFANIVSCYRLSFAPLSASAIPSVNAEYSWCAIRTTP